MSETPNRAIKCVTRLAREMARLDGDWRESEGWHLRYAYTVRSVLLSEWMVNRAADVLASEGVSECRRVARRVLEGVLR